MPRIYVSRSVPPRVLEKLQAYGEIVVHESELPPARNVFLRELAQADAAITMLTEKMDAEAFAAAPNLRVVSNYAVGYDNIDVASATARRIPVGNTPGVLTEATADLAFALILGAARRIGEGITYARNGDWQTWFPLQMLGYDVHGATLGIIGFGRIGQAVARRARGFGMKLVYHGGHDRDAAIELNATEGALDELLHVSDFVSLHVPLKPETRHLIGARELALMKPTSILINTARGAIVDAAALHEALAAGRIAYAALDVTDPEPIPTSHPLLKLPNCLIVPHIGSATYATRERMGMMAAANVIAALIGEPLPNCVNPQVYEA
jgi:glyoxylate reductase